MTYSSDVRSKTLTVAKLKVATLRPLLLLCCWLMAMLLTVTRVLRLAKRPLVLIRLRTLVLVRVIRLVDVVRVTKRSRRRCVMR